MIESAIHTLPLLPLRWSPLPSLLDMTSNDDTSTNVMCPYGPHSVSLPLIPSFLLFPLESNQIKGSLLAVILSGKGGRSVETEKEIDQEEMPQVQ